MRVPIGSHARAPPAAAHRLRADSSRPIAVTCLGRSGTTWLMRMLASHPEIVVYRRFPYESTPAKYWMHMLRVLSEPANMVQSTQPDTFHNDVWAVGNNPYYDDRRSRRSRLARLVRREYVERLARFCQRSIDDWYTTLAADPGPGGARLLRREAQWPNYIPVLMWELYPARQGGVPGARLPRHGALDHGLRPQARALPASAGLREPATRSTCAASCARWPRRPAQELAHPQGTGRTWSATRTWSCTRRRPLRGMLEYLELERSPQTGRRACCAARPPRSDELAGTARRATAERVDRSLAARGRRAASARFCNEVFGEHVAEFGYTDGVGSAAS